MRTSRIDLLAVVAVLLATAGSAFAGNGTIPEPVSTVGLLGASFVALVVGRRFFRK